MFEVDKLRNSTTIKHDELANTINTTKLLAGGEALLLEKAQAHKLLFEIESTVPTTKYSTSCSSTVRFYLEVQNFKVTREGKENEPTTKLTYIPSSSMTGYLIDENQRQRCQVNRNMKHKIKVHRCGHLRDFNVLF